MIENDDETVLHGKVAASQRYEALRRIRDQACIQVKGRNEERLLHELLE